MPSNDEIARDGEHVQVCGMSMTVAEAKSFAARVLREAEALEKEQRDAKERQAAEATRPPITNVVVLKDEGGSLQIAGRDPRTMLPIVLSWNRWTKWNWRHAYYANEVFEGPPVEGRADPFTPYWHPPEALKGCSVSQWRLARAK